MYKVVFFCLLFLSVPLLEARRSGGGGGFSRGSSGARTSSAGGGGFSPNQGGSPGGGSFSPNHGGGQNFGNRPAGGGFNNQPNYGNRGGFNNQPNYNSGFQQQGWNRSPGFNSGSGLGSASRGSTFKHALAGAAVGAIGGLLVYEAGKAIINSATTPFHHANRDYYFDQQNYRGASNVPRCSVPLSQLVNTPAPATTTDGNSTVNVDQTLSNIQFRDGSKPKEVVWACSVGEICCGTDCCPAPQRQYSNNGGSSGSNVGWIVLLFSIILILLTMCCCGCFLVYKCCYSTIERFLPSRSNQQPGYHDDGSKYEYNGQPSQSYPMNSMPNNYPSYPPQNQYPPQTNYGYPPNPGPRY